MHDKVSPLGFERRVEILSSDKGAQCANDFIECYYNQDRPHLTLGYKAVDIGVAEVIVSMHACISIIMRG
jgi:hypothetical protein